MTDERLNVAEAAKPIEPIHQFQITDIFNIGTFGGAKNVYGNAFDNAGLTSHWVQGATVNVQ